MRATRHNGRAGKGGSFKAKHNDRTFDIDNADHIDNERVDQNIYWDYRQGFNYADADGNRPTREMNFEEVELAYYRENFFESVLDQNERHEKTRHPERCRTIEDILQNKKTCPEETIYQLGTIDGHADVKVFAMVVTELLQEMEKRYGTNFQVLDMALHLDEGTPHIHERHVFFADDGYGNLFPKQDKAMEALGFELPNPEKKLGKFNNRKMSFDKEVRALYLEIAQKHGVVLEEVALEGKVHMEKNDYILAKQEEKISEKKAELEELTLKISDIDSMADEVAEKAYERACEVITESVQEETTKKDIALVKNFRDKVTSPDSGASEVQRSFAGKILNEVVDIIMKKTREIAENIKRVLFNPEIKEKNVGEVAKTARRSLRELIAEKKIEAAKLNSEREHKPTRNGREER